jgi:hypothetical protein
VFVAHSLEQLLETEEQPGFEQSMLKPAEMNGLQEGIRTVGL